MMRSSESARVAVDARMLEASGVGTYLRALLPRLVAARPGWRFLCLGDPEALARRLDPRPEHVEVVGHRAPIYSLAEQRPPLAGRPVDLLWVPHYNVPWAWRGRLLVTVHDLAHLALPGIFGRGVRRLYARATLGRVRRRAAGVLFDSRFTAEEFAHRVGPPRGASRVVPLGVDEAWFELEAPPPAATPYFVFVGNVKPHKNLGRLLDGFAAVAGELPHELVLVGQREGFRTADPGLERRHAELGARVRFTGLVAEAELRRVVAGAAALVLPSLYEGFGLPALEAMACGRPVLAARAGALPEVCADAALFFDPRSTGELAGALTRIAGDEALRARLVAAGRARARLFTWEQTAAATLEAMERAVAGGPG